MQLQAIESFLMVYQTKNITHASETLFLTQQCLSHQIKALENELGVKLFVRKKAGMVPTEICNKIYPELKKMMGSYGKAHQICSKQESKGGGRLSVALASGLSTVFDISPLSALVTDVTGQDLVIVEYPGEACRTMLMNHDVDMAFLLEPFDDTMLVHELIFKDYACIAMHKNHPLAAEPGPIALSELDGIKIVTGPNTNSSMEHFWRYCAQSNVYPECVASVTNITGFVNKLKRDDVVVSLLSRLLPQINNPDIVIRKVVSPVLEGRCHCCFHKGAENAELLRGLMHQIKEYFKEEA